MLTWALSVFLALGLCQGNAPEGLLLDFSGGLNTWRSGILLKDNESPKLQNVLLDRNGGISRRDGYSRRNNTIIGDGDDDVNATYQLEQSDGDRYCISFSSTNGYYSTDACQSFTTFISTLTRNNDVNCEPFQDRLYCVSNGYNFFVNGTDDSLISGAPAALDYIRVYRNRCFVAGATGNPSRLYYSALGDCNSWNTTTDYIDFSPEDGDVITGIGEPLFDFLPIYKKYSSFGLKGATPLSFRAVIISNSIGAKNHRSIANYGQIQLFDSLGSNGGHPGIYANNGIVIEEASSKLRNEIEFLDTFKANAGFKAIDSKPDWDSGAFDARTMSSARDPGFMQSSYTTFTDTLGIQFASGTMVNVSTISTPGSLTMVQYASNTFVNAGAEQNSTVNYSATFWSAAPIVDLNFELRRGATIYSNYWWHAGGDGVCYEEVKFDILDTSSVTVKATRRQLPPNGASEFTIDTSTLPHAQIILYVEAKSNNVTRQAYSKPFLRPQLLLVSMFDENPSDACTLGWDVLEPGSYVTSGTFTSQVFDMQISTPVWGLFNVAMSSTAQGGVTFQTQVATSAVGAWDTAVAGTNGSEIISASKPFLRYIGNYNIGAATDTPAMVNSVNVSAASTGTWTSPELFLSANITAGGWGLFQTAQSVSGSEASISYAIKVSSYLGGTAGSGGFTAITPGALITLSTGAYMVVKATFTVGVATETARNDAIIINWAEGAQAKSATGKVFDNRYHYGAQSKDGTRNDVMYVLDSNGAWTKWTGVRPRHLNVVNQNFVMSDSSVTSGGYVFKLYDTFSDNGEAINASWESKDLSLGGINRIKAVDRIYVIHSSTNTTLTTQLLADGGLRSKTYSINLSTGAAFGIKPIVVQPALNANTFRVSVGNNAAAQTWNVLGLMIYYRDLGLMP